MSSVATAPKRAPSGAAEQTPELGARKLPLGADAVLAMTVAGGLALLAFLTTGGVDLAPNTWVEIVVTLIGVAVGAAAVILRAPGRVWGGASLLLFAMLAALTFASIAWSVQPANSWVEANRTLSYLAAFAGALAVARMAPLRWPALVAAVATLATVLAAYALLVKVFPATFAPTDPLGRLHAPFDYWNATGLLAAMGLPACVWAGARIEGPRVLRALTVPAIALLVAVVVLSYSRGALFAAVIGMACWFALAPLRLRGALVIALGAAGGALVALWALHKHQLTHDHVPLAARTTAGHELGLVLLAAMALLSAAGLVAIRAMDRTALPPAARRRVGTALVVLVSLVPIGTVVALALSSRGLGGEVSHIWNKLTNPNGVVGDNPGRLAELSNSRPRYWKEGLKVGEHSLLAGAGAFGYTTARTRYTTDPWRVQHAHSYVVQTFADFGLIGIAVTVALLLAWMAAAARPIGTVSASRAPPQHAAERTGMVTLLAVVAVFGVNSLIDWTWFVPGVTIPALICAGWLAGRGPLPAAPAGRRRSRSAGDAAVAAVGVACAIAAAWGIWQPLRSANADASAITALTRGALGAALADARSAAASDPVSVEPRWELSSIYVAAGDLAAGRRELAKAVSIQPSNPATWLQLGEYDLAHGAPTAAAGELRQAARLDLSSAEAKQQLAAAQAQAR